MRDSLQEFTSTYGRVPLKVPKRCDELLPTWSGHEAHNRVKLAVSSSGFVNGLANRIAKEMSIAQEASLWGVELWALGNALRSPEELGKSDWAQIDFPDLPALAGYVFLKEVGSPRDVSYEFIGHPRQHIWFPRDAEIELLLRGPLTKHLATLTGHIEQVRSLRIEFSEVDQYILREFPDARPHDTDLEPLVRYRGLRQLLISTGEGLTDACLSSLWELKQLAALQLVGSAFTDAGLGLLAHLPLRSLVLRGTGVQGPGLILLEGVEELDIGFNDAVTDEWINRLAGLKNLRFLNLFGTRHSTDTLEMLRSALPKCYIIGRDSR